MNSVPPSLVGGARWRAGIVVLHLFGSYRQCNLAATVNLADVLPSNDQIRSNFCASQRENMQVSATSFGMK